MLIGEVMPHALLAGSNTIGKNFKRAITNITSSTLNHLTSIRCNRWLHGNLDSYSLWLIRTYGPDILETIDWLERDWKPLTSEELQVIYLKCKEFNRRPPLLNN